MRTVVIKKDDLLEVLRANRETHREVYEEALGKYRDKLIGKLRHEVEKLERDDRWNELAEGGAPKVTIDLPVPEDHTKEYNRAISMLEMDTRDEIELEDYEFTQFVEDEWDWKRRWAANTASYTG